MITPQIRPALPNDADAFADCIRAAYAKYGDSIPDMPDVSAGIDQDITDHHVWVADNGTTILGGLVLIVKPPVAKLANIAVHPDAAGRGLGRALIDHAQKQAVLSGCSHMNLTTHVAMPDNVTLYEKLGWTTTGTSGTSVHMQKPL